MKILDFVGIGAPKCATNWLYQCLASHPEIAMLPKADKDTRMFLDNPDPATHEKLIKKFFDSNPGKTTGDFVESYFSNPEAPAGIFAHNPEIKIILILRDLFDRAFSQFQHIKSLLPPDVDYSLKEIISTERYKFTVIENGRYATFLKNYTKFFDHDKIHVLLFENIKSTPELLIHRLYSFLNVNPAFIPPNIQVKVNSGKFKNTKLAGVLHKYVFPAVKRFQAGKKLHASPVARNIFFKLTNMYTKIGAKHREGFPGSIIDQLKQVYNPEIDELSHLLNQNLSHWKRV